VAELSRDLQDKNYPIEARSLGRTLKRWKHQIAAWHAAQVSNGPTEAVNNRSGGHPENGQTPLISEEPPF
jgi:transposase